MNIGQLNGIIINHMIPENKELLLKDLCARLPYKPQIKFSVNGVKGYEVCELPSEIITSMFFNEDIEIKPYLRPMSSMTHDEDVEYMDVMKDGHYGRPSQKCASVVDWLNEHHFDYRGLIEKGLALEAPEGMYKAE